MTSTVDRRRLRSGLRFTPPRLVVRRDGPLGGYESALARETVLVSGGRPLRAENSEAAVMAGILKNEFGIAVRWREEQSQDTAGNAHYSAEVLRQAGITRVVLVTQAFHMPRARLLFEAAGLQVVPAPAHFVSKTGGGFAASDLLPGASALHHSYYALHEWLGIAWARLSGV